MAPGLRFRRWPVGLVVLALGSALALGLAALAGAARGARVVPDADVDASRAAETVRAGARQAAGPDRSGSALAASSQYDLDADERLGGHTLERHVGRTDDELAERLRREPQISAASTYTDAATARRTVSAAIDASRGRIDGWSRRSGSRPNLVLAYTSSGRATIGRSLARGARAATPCTRALVVLRWLERERRWYVLTSYPEASR